MDKVYLLAKPVFNGFSKQFFLLDNLLNPQAFSANFSFIIQYLKFEAIMTT